MKIVLQFLLRTVVTKQNSLIWERFIKTKITFANNVYKK